MAVQKLWYIICYDITEPKRWRVVYKKLHGYGRRLQYSIFRCRLTALQMERLRWELEELLNNEDKLLILSLCDSCEQRVSTHNRPESWAIETTNFEIA
ncbi:MAG: CRISPR-associated endonuclease Cas2 [Candidatus Tectomicrobia bacterium]|uniref:CRISPR-associated endoribonuclease Cas2 n=1 Tax=Tectimicrobiota bacterium TaxID=2528274 RepID=A0A938B1U4_UNCTE|nr:CRISPR-associated endonuclease Cas2 [Candidatus Tectomicrobia bacterium]